MFCNYSPAPSKECREELSLAPYRRILYNRRDNKGEDTPKKEVEMTTSKIVWTIVALVFVLIPMFASFIYFRKRLHFRFMPILNGLLIFILMQLMNALSITLLHVNPMLDNIVSLLALYIFRSAGLVAIFLFAVYYTRRMDLKSETKESVPVLFTYGYMFADLFFNSGNYLINMISMEIYLHQNGKEAFLGSLKDAGQDIINQASRAIDQLAAMPDVFALEIPLLFLPAFVIFFAMATYSMFYVDKKLKASSIPEMAVLALLFYLPSLIVGLPFLGAQVLKLPAAILGAVLSVVFLAKRCAPKNPEFFRKLLMKKPGPDDRL